MNFQPEEISQDDFIADDDGIVVGLGRLMAALATLRSSQVEVVLTCPLSGNSDSWASRIRILTSEYKETQFILAKQMLGRIASLY